MTKREFMEKIIAGTVTKEEMIEYAKKEIETLDKRNAARRSKPTAKQKENEIIKEQMLKTLKGMGKMTASAIGEKMGFSTNKASALCRQLVTEGKMTEEDVKVPKKGMQIAYTVIEEQGE